MATRNEIGIRKETAQMWKVKKVRRWNSNWFIFLYAIDKSYRPSQMGLCWMWLCLKTFG